MSITSNRARAIAVAALLLVLGLAFVAWLGLSRAAAAGQSMSTTALSARLAEAPDLSLAASGTLSSAAAAQTLAEKLEPATPLPPGGTLDDIHYENATGLAPEVLAGVVQFNAACDWWLYLRDHPDAAAAQQVVAEIPQWPVFREPANAALAATVAAGLGDATGRGEAVRLVKANCEHP